MIRLSAYVTNITSNILKWVNIQKYYIIFEMIEPVNLDITVFLLIV